MKNRPLVIRFLRRLKRPAGLLFCFGASLLILPVVRATEGDITAISGRVSDDYVRVKLPDGSFESEAYAFGEGGHLSGSAHDDTIDKLHFIDVARTIAQPLAGQNYVTAKDPNQTKLMIMVYWGTTAGTAEDPNLLVMFGHDPAERLQFSAMRNRTDFKNAQLLGYDSEDIIGTDYGRALLVTAAHLKAEDLLDEIGDNRYFVVLMAYDFQLMWKEKKTKLLWETRFSIRENRNDFGVALPAMARYASRYFGQDSHGLIRKPLHESVTLDELKILNVEPENK